MTRQNAESVNLKRGLLKSSSKARGKKNESEESLRELWDISKWTNICLMGEKRGGKKKKREKKEKKKGQKFKEIMAESFPNLRKEMGIQIQEAPEI